MNSVTRTALNTIVQYTRTIISAVISLFTARLILRALGVDDYGINQLVAGIIGMFSFIQGSLTTTTVRYLSFHRDNSNLSIKRSVFANCRMVFIIASVVLLCILLLISPFVGDGLLNIPINRSTAATVVFVCMSFGAFFTMMATPYLSVLYAHENLVYSSFVQIIDAVLKIPIALSLLWFPWDKLMFLAPMTLSINILNFCMYYFFCIKHYDECKDFSYSMYSRKMLKELSSFTGWMLYSSMCVVGRTQGLAVVLNRFVGTVANAAYGIAWSLAGQLAFLEDSLSNALSPQLMAAESRGERYKMFRLAMILSKAGFLLLAGITIPVMFNMEKVLFIWLGQVPPLTVPFCCIIITTTLIDCITIGLIPANRAIGNVGAYSITINTIKILTLPCSVIYLYMVNNPIIGLCFVPLFEFFCAIGRLYFLRRYGGLSISEFCHRVFLRELIPLLSILVVSFSFNHIFIGYWTLFSIPASFAVMALTTYGFGLCSDERKIVCEMFAKNKKEIW